MRFRRFCQTHDILVRNFPTEMLLLAPLQKMLLEKNGTAGISHKCARRRQNGIAGAVLHLDPVPEKGRIAGHTFPSVKGVSKGINGTKGLPLRKLCGNVWKTRISLPWKTAGRKRAILEGHKRASECLTFAAAGLLSAFRLCCSQENK